MGGEYHVQTGDAVMTLEWKEDSLNPMHEWAEHEGKVLHAWYNENTGVVWGAIDGEGEFDEARVSIDTQRGCDPDFTLLKRVLEEIVLNPFKE